MKKLVYSLTAVVAFALVALVYKVASAANVPQHSPNTPAAQFNDPAFVGVGEFRLETSTPADVAVLLSSLNGQSFSGSGLVYEVSATSGAVGDICSCFDAASASGITRASQGKRIGPDVLSVGYPATAGSAGSTGAPGTTGATVAPCSLANLCGDWRPIWPARFENGLVCLKSSNGVNCTVLVRSDSGGVNPMP